MKNRFFSVFVLVILFLCGCKQTIEQENQKLSAHEWRLVQDYYKNVDSFPFYPACRQDDLMKFHTDGTYSLSDGSLFCGSSAQMESGTWEISKSLALKIQEDNSTEIAYNMDVLTADSLIISPILLNDGRKRVYVKN